MSCFSFTQSVFLPSPLFPLSPCPTPFPSLSSCPPIPSPSLLPPLPFPLPPSSSSLRPLSSLTCFPVSLLPHSSSTRRILIIINLRRETKKQTNKSERMEFLLLNRVSFFSPFRWLFHYFASGLSLLFALRRKSV